MSKIKMVASEALVEQLVAEGVKTVWGIVGSAYMDALDLFPAAGIRFISGAHEQAAGPAADPPHASLRSSAREASGKLVWPWRSRAPSRQRRQRAWRTYGWQAFEVRHSLPRRSPRRWDLRT